MLRAQILSPRKDSIVSNVNMMAWLRVTCIVTVVISPNWHASQRKFVTSAAILMYIFVLIVFDVTCRDHPTAFAMSSLGHDGVAYSLIKERHASLPAFQPTIPTFLLPYLAFALLTSAFLLTFYFSTLPKSMLAAREILVASIASILAGFGIVAVFCSVGVYV